MPSSHFGFKHRKTVRIPDNSHWMFLETHDELRNSSW